MVDHEGHVKEIEWNYVQTGPHEGDIIPVLKDYANPDDAPERLFPHHHPSLPAAAQDCIPRSRALEAALLMCLVGVLIAYLYSLVVLRRRQVADTPATAEDPSAPLILADFPRLESKAGEGMPTCSPSSCVTKTEAFLRFAGIPYSKQTGFADPAPSPKAQLPYLDRGRQRISGCHSIIKHLLLSGAAPAGLEFPAGPRERAVALAVARICDADLAACIDFYRWVDDEGWARCRKALLGPYHLLAPVRAVLARMARKASFTRAWEQGIARRSNADRLDLAQEELAALAQLLGDQPFLFGSSPHAVDASAFGVLDQMAARDLNPRLADLLTQHPNLVAYRERIRTQYFGLGYAQEVAWLDEDGGLSRNKQPSSSCQLDGNSSSAPGSGAGDQRLKED